MARTSGLLDALVDEVERRGHRRSGRAALTRWKAADPVACSGLEDIGGVAEAIRSAGPADQDRLIAALLGVADGDEVAQLTIVAGLSRRLGWVLTGWQRSGLAPDMEELESDLVATCWAAVAAAAAERPAGGGAPRLAWVLVEAARDAVRVPRRREKRIEARRVPLVDAERLAARDPRSEGEALALGIVEATLSGRLTLRAATVVYSTRVSGWPVSEVAVRLGCSPGALRVQRGRAERLLAAA